MKFQIEVITLFEIPYRPDQYPAGMTPQQALAFEVDELKKDPRELPALGCEVIGVRGMILRDEPRPSSFADLAERTARPH